VVRHVAAGGSLFHESSLAPFPAKNIVWGNNVGAMLASCCGSMVIVIEAHHVVSLPPSAMWFAETGASSPLSSFLTKREDSLDTFLGMSPAGAAAFEIALLIFMMMTLKGYVGMRRQALKLPSGETNPEFNRATRVQLNAVEDVPPLMVGIAALAMLGMPAWYIHAAGLALVVSRAAHATGLAGSGGFSWGRVIGTLGTYVVAIAVAGALLVHAFTPPAHG
jgi:uncharacterized protein